MKKQGSGETIHLVAIHSSKTHINGTGFLFLSAMVFRLFTISSLVTYYICYPNFSITLYVFVITMSSFPAKNESSPITLHGSTSTILQSFHIWLGDSCECILNRVFILEWMQYII